MFWKKKAENIKSEFVTFIEFNRRKEFMLPIDFIGLIEHNQENGECIVSTKGGQIFQVLNRFSEVEKIVQSHRLKKQ